MVLPSRRRKAEAICDSIRLVEIDLLLHIAPHEPERTLPVLAPPHSLPHPVIGAVSADVHLPIPPPIRPRTILEPVVPPPLVHIPVLDVHGPVLVPLAVLPVPDIYVPGVVLGLSMPLPLVVLPLPLVLVPVVGDEDAVPVPLAARVEVAIVLAPEALGPALGVVVDGRAAKGLAAHGLGVVEGVPVLGQPRPRSAAGLGIGKGRAAEERARQVEVGQPRISDLGRLRRWTDG
mmetsp:Transcript_3406/g.7073  ORF Transcript_3406/g.7073 Transcript_3406/m.7073 type:complete len:233 (-) Transcript_3406:3913-4611(-)